MKKILVTGAGGFIGYNLCNYLVDQGHSVIGVDLHYPDKVLKEPRNGFQHEVSDFRNCERMKEWLSGIDVVFHLASAHLQINLDEKDYWNINVHSLRPLLDLAMQSGVQRFVHVSSVGAYGDLKRWPANEKTPCEPQSIYGETKLAGESEVRKFSEETGFPVVIIRPAWVYGPYCPRTLKIYRTLRKGQFIMIGDGENLRHPIYIADMLEAFRLAMEADSAVGELFIIAGQRSITTNELVEGFCKVLKVPKPKIRISHGLGAVMAWGFESVFGLARIEPPISRRSLEFFETNNAFDISKAMKLLGFGPKFSFEDGLRESQEWLMGHA
ncbi:MAG: NAD(P)-dependent oxidoreductase [ANME-2 cluster archaeon]|nr:NAD(P)-dependent oxidoreductase [ANME-2 cluster archaeon]